MNKLKDFVEDFVIFLRYKLPFLLKNGFKKNIKLGKSVKINPKSKIKSPVSIGDFTNINGKITILGKSKVIIDTHTTELNHQQTPDNLWVWRSRLSRRVTICYLVFLT